MKCGCALKIYSDRNLFFVSYLKVWKYIILVLLQIERVSWNRENSTSWVLIWTSEECTIQSEFRCTCRDVIINSRKRNSNWNLMILWWNTFLWPVGPSLWLLFELYILVSSTRLCVVYVVKEVTSFPGARQLMGVARKRTHDQALQTSERKLCNLRRNWNK